MMKIRLREPMPFLRRTRLAGKVIKMKLSLANKKSQLLTPSSLPCLTKIPTINISAGCLHNCVYCYSKGYSNYPGDGNITIYSNLVEKLSAELAHKRNPPYSVYFCPSCDPFQPAKEILESNISDKKLLAKIIDSYKTGSKIKIGTGNSAGVALPADIRNQLYKHIRKIARQFSISVHICGCKNNDITSESCRITKPQSSDQIGLF
jgi:hypothetical protein